MNTRSYGVPSVSAPNRSFESLRLPKRYVSDRRPQRRRTSGTTFERSAAAGTAIGQKLPDRTLSSSATAGGRANQWATGEQFTAEPAAARNRGRAQSAGGGGAGPLSSQRRRRGGARQLITPAQSRSHIVQRWRGEPYPTSAAASPPRPAIRTSCAIPSRSCVGTSAERVTPPPAPGPQSVGASARQGANGAPLRLISEPQISGDGGVFIDRALRERVEGDIAVFLTAFDAALAHDTPESRAGLRVATDRLLRAGARTRIELERLEARVPLPPRNGGKQYEPAGRPR